MLLSSATVSAILTAFFPPVKQSPWLTVLVILHVLIVAAAIFFLLEFGRSLRKIEHGIGTAAELVAESAGTSKGEYFDHLRAMIEHASAGDEILILTYHARGTGGEGSSPTPEYLKARARYFDPLLRGAREGVTYRRILSFEDFASGERVRTAFVRDHILQHCRQMLQTREERPGAISVKKARAYVMADLFILNSASDSDVGAFSLETYAQRERMYTAGALIVQDPPNGRMLDQFREWWQDADDHSAFVEADELARE